MVGLVLQGKYIILMAQSRINKSDLWYDRSNNIEAETSNDSIFNIYPPTYGSKASFSSNVIKMDYEDSLFSYKPRGINSMVANFVLVYKYNKETIQKIIKFLEDTKGVVSFYIDAEYTSSNEDKIYNSLSGYCDGYSVIHRTNNDYQLTIKFSIEEEANLFNWRSLNFLNYQAQDWQTNKEYKKNDVVYFAGNNKKITNYYYCTSDHISEGSKDPKSWYSNWDQDFHWCPDSLWQNEVEFKIEKLGRFYSTRMQKGKNSAVFPITYEFSSIDTKQLKSMLHFLESHGGYMRFPHNVPSLYNLPKVLIATEWSHKWNGKNSHNLSVSMIEDPLGVLPNKNY